MLALKAFGEFQRFATTAEEHAKKPVFRFSIKQPGMLTEEAEQRPQAHQGA
jgi:hypothetical protein